MLHPYFYAMPRTAKKILDIFPPRNGISLQEVFSRSKEEKEKKTVLRHKLPPRPTLPRKTAGAVLLFILAGIIGTGLYLKLLETRIEIWPVKERWDFKEELRVSTSFSAPDLNSKTIPGKIMEDVQELSQQFDATGKSSQEEKAQGTIKVYNQYNLPQILIAKTRFLSADGKLFRSKERVSVPTGGAVDVAVEAAEAGEDYNIGPTKFSVPGLAGSPRYTSVYGESFAAMAGGRTSEAPQVTASDIEKAKESLRAALLQGGSQKIRYKLTGDTVLFDGALMQEEGDIESLAASGAQVARFNVRGSLKSRGLVFQKKDMEQFVRDFVGARIPEGKTYNQKSLTIQFTLKDIDWDNKRMATEVAFSVDLYPLINPDDIKSSVSGKKYQEAQDIIANDSRVSRAAIKFWPLPAAKVSDNKDKIKITLRLD